MLKAFLQKPIRAIILRLLRVRVTYSDETIALMRSNRVIVCANHVSLLDGVIVALASPMPLTFGVDTEFSIHSKIAKNGFAILCWLRFGSVVPIDSKSPFGIRSLSNELNKGKSVMIFPEGEISATGQPKDQKLGLVWLEKRTGGRVIWIKIIGAEKSKFFAKAGKQLWPPIEIKF